MALYNPYRNYEQGMDDAFMGKEPSNPNNQSYMEGYERYQQMDEQTREEQINEEFNGEIFD